MNPMKILLVDDSKSARYALRLQLQRHGAQVETADSAEAALERIEEDPPDAVFMDHIMPGMNGIEALDILKSSLLTTHIPVVMCTSYENPDFFAQARRKGAFGILSKAAAPDKLPDLLECLKRTISADSATPPAQGLMPEGGVAQDEAERPITEGLDARMRALIGPALEGIAERLGTQLIASLERRPPGDDGLEADPLPRFARGQVAGAVQEMIVASVGRLVGAPDFLHKLLTSIEATASGRPERQPKREGGEAVSRPPRSARERRRMRYLLAAGAAGTGLVAAAIYLMVR